MKRVLSLVLCLCMILSMLPVESFAQTLPAEETAPQETVAETTGSTEATTEATTEPRLTETTAATEETVISTEATETIPETTSEEETLPQETQPEETQPELEMETVTVTTDPGVPDNDTLFKGYAQNLFYGNGAVALGSAAGELLTGDEKLVYDALVPLIRDIAAGNRADTDIGMGRTVRDSKGNVYTADVSVTFTGTAFSKESLENVMNALLADLPYELYWYDKVTGCTALWFKGNPMPFLSISLIVADNYKGENDYTADTAKTGAASTSAENAKALVEKYRISNDYQKLLGYSKEICSLVSYNHSAASGGSFAKNDDPWQLIYVFDGDSTTNVVCEGYSKAFMYLCDLTSFRGDVACYTVSGTLSGEGHMWNIVTLEGQNYLVDVTNSDTGTIGARGGLFLAGGSGSISNGYYVLGRSFKYDSDTKSIWGTGSDSILKLSSSYYTPSEEKMPETQQELLTALEEAGEAGFLFTGSLTLTEDMTLPEGQLLTIGDGGSLTIPENVTLILRGSLMVEEGCSLENSGTILCRKGALAVKGTYTAGEKGALCNDFSDAGEISGVTNDNIHLYYAGAVEQDVRALLGIVTDDCVEYPYLGGLVTLNGDMTLTDDLTIPANVALNVEAALTVPEGMTLRNNGAVELESGSNLINDGTVAIGGEVAIFSLTAATLKIGKGAALTNNAALTVAAGTVLENNGQMTNAPQGIVYNNGVITVAEDATLTNEGAIRNNQEAVLEGSVTGNAPEKILDSQGELEEALGAAKEAGETCVFTGNLTLERDLKVTAPLVIASGASLVIPQELTLSAYYREEPLPLTVEAGGSLRVEGTLLLEYLSLTVEADGSLTLAAGSRAEVYCALTACEGAVCTMEEKTLWTDHPDNIQGIAPENVCVAAGVNSLEELAQLLLAAETCRYQEIAAYLGAADAAGNRDTCVSHRNLTIPANATVSIGVHGLDVVLPDACLWTNKGELTLRSDNALILEPGAVLCNEGTLLLSGENRLEVGGELRNAAGGVLTLGGAATIREGGVLTNGGTVTLTAPVTNNGTIVNLHPAVFADEQGLLTGNAATIRGTAGELTWVLDENGMLTLSGAGAMEDYSTWGEAPWLAWRQKITGVTIGEGITHVGAYAFENCEFVTSLTMADTVESIGEAAFYQLYGLQDLVIPESVGEIDTLAFYGCLNVRNITMPVSAAVGTNAFQFCAEVTYVTLTPGTGVMADYDETSCLELPWNETTNRSHITVAEGVKVIGAYAFCGSPIESIRMADSVEILGEYALHGTGLASLTLPGKLREIGNYALAEMKNIRNLELPASVTAIGAYAFTGMTALRAVTLPEGLTVLSEGVFRGCELLDTVVVPDSVQEIGAYAFYHCKALYNINIPEGVTEIREYTFVGCGINNIKLPSTLRSIGQWAFQSCGNISVLTIPAGVQYIDSFAFAWCEYIDILVMNSRDITIADNAFYDCYCYDIFFSGNAALWNVADDAAGVRIGNSGNSCLIYGNVYNQEYVAVEEVHILDPNGTFGEKNALLDGKVIHVDLNKVSSFKLRYQVLPENALFQDTIWTSDEWDLVGSATVDSKGDLTVKGLQPGEMTIFAQNFLPEAEEILGYDPYTYTTASLRFVFHRYVTSLSIEGDYEGMAALGMPLELYAEIAPANAGNKSLIWSVVNGTGAGYVDRYGVFTGTRRGTVTVRAETTDGSGIVAEKQLTVTEYGVEISAPDKVYGGKTVALKARLIPYNLYNTTIAWRLADPADEEYVTLNGSKLTAKKVTEAHTVTVIAFAEDGSGAQSSHSITVVPMATELKLSWIYPFGSGEDSTLTFDLNAKAQDNDGILLTAAILPGDAEDAVAWTVSDTKNAYGEYVQNGASLRILPTGKTGTITVTAKATDGSGKSDKVTIKLVRLPNEITFDIPDDSTHIRGGAKMTLKTNLDTDKTLTSKAVNWEIPEDSVPYATINAKGVLTTRVVSVPTLITVQVTAKDNPQVTARQTFTLHPAVDQVQLMWNGQTLKDNATIPVDLQTGTVALGAVLNPEDSIQKGSWSTSSKKLATVDENGVVTLLKAGTVTITFKASDGSKKSAKVKLKITNLAETVTLTAPAAQLTGGSSMKIAATVLDAEGNAPSSKSLRWTSSDTTAATVDSKGKVTAKTVYEKTTVTITAEAKDGSGAAASVTVEILPKKEQTLTLLLNGENVTGKTVTCGLSGQTLQLGAAIYDYTGSNSPLAGEFTSKNKKVATVDETGIVTLLAPGSTVLTAKTESGTVQCTLKVMRYVEQVQLTGSSDTLVSGKSLTLKAAATAESGKPTSTALLWSSSDESAATVSAKGKVTAQKVYQRKTVTITATAKDTGLVSGSYVLTVVPAATTVSIFGELGEVLNNRTVTVQVGDSLQLEGRVYPYLGGVNGALQEVTWSTSSKMIATVDENGCVTFLKKGTVTIKATAQDGTKKTVSFKLVVKNP